ncbi:hypothetical protein EfmJHP38_34120 (plasmid) [Enterococcus faecium]|nr:hypothetical protein EfmJHP38_34120 [Enterococcus faecium]
MKNRGLKSSSKVAYFKVHHSTCNEAKTTNVLNRKFFAYFKVHHSTCNEAKTTNVLNRKFLRDNPLEAIVTDLTYVRVGKKWNYVCFILDLFNHNL